MNRILVIAFDSELEKILQIVNTSKTEIQCVISFPTNDLNKILEKCNVDCEIAYYDAMPEIVREKYFDYCIVSDVFKNAGTDNRIVADLKRVGVPAEKILDLSHFAAFPFFSIYNALKNFTSAPKEKRGKYKFFVTGVSHAYAGTDIKEFSMPGLNLALTSQDLFYDYELAKIVLRNKREIKFAIIGVAPFSLHYDLSQSVNVSRTYAYYPVTKTLHNNPIKEKVLQELFSDAYLRSYDIFDTEINFDGCLRFCGQNKNFFVDDWIAVREKMAAHESKVYQPTLAENKKILRNYVSDCLKAKVQPLLVMYPVSEFYNKYFPAQKFAEVRYFLTDLAQDFKVQFLDFSADKNFVLQDFFDVEHLNINGAKKFSKMLDEKLSELDSERSF